MNENLALAGRILANDLRLYFRAWQRRGVGRFGGLALQILFPLWMHLAVYPLLNRFGPDYVPGAAEFACVFVVLLLVMVALQRSLEVLYNRGDLPMLLASPVPVRVIVLTRLADVQVTTWLASGLVMLPLLDVAVWLHGTYWAWGWVAWLAAGFALVPAALWLTVASMRLLGPRRARGSLQILSLVLGLVAIAGAQAPNWMGQFDDTGSRTDGYVRFFTYFDVPSLRALADAARGDVQGLMQVAVLGLVLGAGAFWLLVRDFTRGAQTAATDLGTSRRRLDERQHGRLWPRRFAVRPWRAILQKELRLVRRDPLLMVRASTQLVSLLPALAVVLWNHTAAGIAAFSLVGPAIVAVTIAAMMTINDEAHVIVRSSPLTPRRAAWARTGAAAMIPALIAVALAIGTAALGNPTIALVSAAMGTLNAVSLAWLGTCTVRPLSVEERALHRRPRIMPQYLFAMLIGGLGASGVTLWAMEQAIASRFLLGFAVLFALSAFAARPAKYADEAG